MRVSSISVLAAAASGRLLLRKSTPAISTPVEEIPSFSPEDMKELLLEFPFKDKFPASDIADRLEQVLKHLKEKATGCPDKETTFNPDKLICDMDENGWDSKCRCKDASKTLTAVKECEVNHCGGAYSTSCLGVQDQKTAWINEFLSGAFIPIFNDCCDTHDRGYCIPGTSKLSVDKTFLQCMKNTCDEHDDHRVKEECSEEEKCNRRGKKCRMEQKCKTKQENKNRWCKLRALISYTAVERGGLKSFNAKQDSMMEC